MKNFKAVALLVAAVGASALAPTVVRAQDVVDTAAPVVVKQTPEKAVWMKATVVHADAVSLIVRERGNEMAIHTFTYSDAARDKMQDIIANGGYQNGDPIRILWMPGTQKAIKFKGRPSKGV